jgi:hypothetical protein
LLETADIRRPPGWNFECLNAQKRLSSVVYRFTKMAVSVRFLMSIL